MAKCEFCDKGVTFGIQVSTPTAVSNRVEAQCEAREGDRGRALLPTCTSAPDASVR